MRVVSLTLWDIKFQVKYGFYLLYGILTSFYLVVLFSLPLTWRENATAILIFSDPAATGLFFMGAIVLLEKSQRIPSTFAVSPVRAREYIVAKVVSLCAIAFVVAAILAIAARVEHLPYTLIGTVLSSVIFTLLGIIIATKVTSLNQFILWTVPIEILGSVPAVFHLFGTSPAILHFYPANVCMDMIAGNQVTPVGLFFVVVLIIVLFIIARNCVLKMWKSAGGIKL